MGLFDGIVKAVAGPIVGGLFGMKGQQDANSANAAIAADNREWQEELSNTAHQREVRDLAAAGLNPMLSLKGAGASTPTPPTPTMQSTTGEMARGLSAVNAQQVENMQAQNKLLEAQTAKTEAEKAEIEARTPTYKANIDEITARIPTYGATVKEIEERINTYAPTIEEIRARTGLHSMNAAESGERINNLRDTRVKIGAEIAQLIATTKESYARTNLINAQIALNGLDQVFRRNEIGIQEYETLIKRAQSILQDQHTQGAGKNKFESDLTWWGRNVRPYLQDFLSGANGAAAGAAAGARLGK